MRLLEEVHFDVILLCSVPVSGLLLVSELVALSPSHFSMDLPPQCFYAGRRVKFDISSSRI
jgi:hypothetical protein